MVHSWFEVNKKADIWEFTVYLLFPNFIFLFPSFFPNISVVTCTEQNIHQSRTNWYNSALFSSPLWFLFIFVGARSPGEPGQTFLRFSVCVLTNSFLQHLLLIYTQNSKLHLLVSFRPPLVLFPLPSLQQGLQVRQKWIPERYNNISSVTFLFLFLSISLSVCLFVIRKLLHSNDTNSRKTSAVCSQYKECQTYSNNEKVTSGRAFAVSVLFSYQSSDRSYPPVSLSVCLSFNSSPQLVFLLLCLLTSSLLRLLYFPINSSFIHLEKCN